MPNTGQRSDLWITHLTVNGTPIVDSWDKKTGGSVDPAETKYRPGGSPAQISLGGSQDVANVTLERLFVKERDAAVLAFLAPLAGKAVATVSQQALDSDYLPWGNPIIYQGRLGKCTIPDQDSNSQAASMISVEVSVSGVPKF